VKLSEKILTYHVAQELFPRCVDCGESIEGLRLGELVAVTDRPNRFAHLKCRVGSSEEGRAK
jgi:hypothetical protein